MKKVNNIHRGEVLKSLIAASDLNITIVTNRAGYNRSSYYNHILIPDLSYSILRKYGRALNHDFSREFPEMRSYDHLEDPQVLYGGTPTIAGLTKQRDDWKDKYLQLLEKYNQLIEGQLLK